MSLNLPVEPKVVHHNPTAEQLKAWTIEQETVQVTDFGAPNTKTKVLARSKGSTYIISDTPENHSDQCISTEEGAKWAQIQNDYIKDQEMVVIDGYIGNDPEFRTPTRLIIEKSNANIAGMQQQLYFPLDGEAFEPELTVVYTPRLKAESYPADRLISVDLENKITRVFNSDYFGESKKGGLRMWNKLVYDRGGLSLHAGCKIIPVDGKDRVALIVGLSGTGKTTTTFTQQNNSKSVQDDFVALMPGGAVYSSENGCFAKTYGLNADFEPAIYKAVNQADAYLENVSQAEEGGPVDYFDESYTKNGRATFCMDKVEGSADARSIKEANILLILNCNENIIPAVSRLNKEQAAAYFMLGETRGTSAGGKAEEGKNLRVPGTNPFYPGLHAEQANRLKELLDTCDLEVYLLNTGRVGGNEDVEGSKKVKIPHSSAIVKAIAEGTIEYAQDPDFGYEVATKVPGISDEDVDLLQPKKLYEAMGRMEEYQGFVDRLKSERKEYLQSWPGLDQAIIDAV